MKNYRSYFYIKQLSFLAVSISVGLFTMVTLFIAGTALVSMFVEKDPNDNLNGMGEMLLVLFCSSTLSVLTGIVSGAVVSGRLAAKKCEVYDQDLVYPRIVRAVRWVLPYAGAVLVYGVICMVLMRNDSDSFLPYVLVGLIQIPGMIYLIDRTLFGTYFE